MESTQVTPHQGAPRTSTCHLPAHTAAPQALIVALHGRNLTVGEMRRLTHLDPTSQQSLPATARDATSVERFGWKSGQGGTEVACWIVEKGGHTWPGGPPAMGLGLLGRTTTHFDAGNIICQFMATHWHPAVERALDGIAGAAPPP